MSTKNKIVVLGWGSLIWEPRDDYKKVIGSWKDDGPILPIEFSRISSSRNGSLTLVIDPDNGSQVQTKYTISKRNNPEDAACDLRTREGTVIRHIGIIDLDTGFVRGHFRAIVDKIKLWAVERQFRAVIWTDLPSNFTEKTGKIFTPENALKYLKSLPESGQRSAKEYIKNAPKEAQTPLRAAAEEDGWLAADQISAK